MLKLICDRCNINVELQRELKRINGKKLCNDCYIKNRKERRKIVLRESPEDYEAIREIERKKSRERYRKKHSKIEKIPYEPKIKDSTKKVLNKSNSFITIQEKQCLFRMLLNRGIDYDEAKERVKELVKEQKRINNQMKENNKSEKEIKERMSSLLEELYRH